MAKMIKKENKKYYQCGICKFVYKDKNWADKCEEWCKKHKSCNMSITNYAVNDILEHK